MTNTLQLDDLLRMNNKALKQIFFNSHPIDINALANKNYRGIDLSLPKLVNKILWKEFRKTFYKDPDTGIFRGWNVRMEQVGWDKQGIPMTKKNGEELTFGHYHVLSGAHPTFPEDWPFTTYLDYGIAGNTFFDFARFTLAPLVAVNQGSNDLLLGTEIVKLGNKLIHLPDYWALKLEGEISHIAPPPKTK